MTRLIYEWPQAFSFFDESNWTFYTRELYPILKDNFITIMFIWESFLDFEFINTPLYYSNMNFFNFYFSYNELVYLNSNLKNQFLYNVLFDQYASYLQMFYYMDLNTLTVFNTVMNSVIFFFFNYFINFLFIFLLVFLILLKWHLEYGSVMEDNRPVIGMYYQYIVYDMLVPAFTMFESYEEAICIMILWPWCIFLVFTHIFFIENNEIFFIFIEWGLPVIYGYLLILEHLWNYGIYFFVYLNGARGRRSFLITLFEDCVAFFIVIARISLQVVRGLLCGFFHDFFRELTEYTVDVWEEYWVFVDWRVPFFRRSFTLDAVMFFIDWYLFSFILLFIYVILFLQLLFLLIAVWLFCRCWFISTQGVSETLNYYKRNVKFNKFFSRRENNLKYKEGLIF